MSKDSKSKAEILQNALVEAMAAGATELASGADADRIAVAAALAAVKQGAKDAGPKLVSLFLDSPDRRLRAAMAQEFGERVAEVAPELEERLQALVDDEQVDDSGLAGALGATLDAVAKAYSRTVDPRKQRLLMAAVVGSFDKETFRKGLSRRLIEILDRLDYGDIWELKFWCGADRRKVRSQATSLSRDHYHRLVSEHLLIVPPNLQRQFDGRNNVGELLLLPSELGRELLALVETRGHLEGEAG